MSDDRAIPRWLWIALAVFVAAVAFVAWWVFVPPSRAPIDAKIAELRAAGFAVRPSEVPGAIVPDEQNGAAEFDAAIRWLLDNRGRPQDWKVTGPWDDNVQQPWEENATREQLAELRAFLETLGPFFERIDTALARPALQWPLPDEPGGDAASAAHIPDVQGAMKVLAAHAHVAARPEERLASWLRMLRMGERLRQRTLLESMVSLACTASGVSGPRRLAQERALPAATLRRALEAERVAEQLPRIRAMLRGELAFAAWEATQLDRPALDSGSFLGTGERWSPGRVAAFLETLRRVSEIDTRDLPTALAELRRIEPVADMDGAWELVLTRAAMLDSSLRLTRIALAATERREKDGVWPASLDALAADFSGAVPLDPRSGKPFRYDVKDGVATFETSGEDQGAGSIVDLKEERRERGLLIEIRR